MEAKGPKSTGLMQRLGRVRYLANNGDNLPPLRVWRHRLTPHTVSCRWISVPWCRRKQGGLREGWPRYWLLTWLAIRD